MLRKGVSKWRQVRHLAEEKASLARRFSETPGSGGGAKPVGGPSRPNPLGEEAVGSRLFERAKMPPPEMEEAASSSSQGADQAFTSTAGRVLGTIGNTLFLGALGVSAFFGYYTFKYTTDQINTMVEETEKPENAYPGSSIWTNVMSYYAYQRERMEKEWTKYAEPPSDRLLPDQHPQLRNVQTLVLDLDDLLIHSDWTRGRGWRTFKRPGADDFIKALAPYFEMVIYTHQLPTYADPILDRLDPQHLISYRLYRDSTRYIDGKHMRDLSKLNRDLSKVVILSTDPETTSLQKENAVMLKKWKMESNDTVLLDLIPFLEALFTARSNIDIRNVLASYEGQDIAKAFREKMIHTRDLQQQQRQKKMSLFGSLAGR